MRARACVFALLCPAVQLSLSASASAFASCSSSSSLLVSLRCDVTLDQSELTFWSSDPSRDTTSAWLQYSYASTSEVGSYMVQATKTGFTQQSPSRWRLYAGLTANDLQFVEERNVGGWKSLEQRMFKLAVSVRAVHVRIEFLAVEFPVSGQNPIFSITSFAAYPPVVFAFFTSDWSECSEPCDGGTQTREVACWGDDGRRDYAIADCEFSLGAAPETTQACNTKPCLMPEISEVRARPGSVRTDELNVSCYPNSATDAQCLALLATEDRVPAYAEVTASSVPLRPCAPPSCSFSIYGLTGNTAYIVYCAVAEVLEVEMQSVVGLTQPVFTASSNVTAVAVSNLRESSADVTVTLKEAMATSGVDVICTAVQLVYTTNPSTYSYMKSDLLTTVLPLRPDLAVQADRCTQLTCELSFNQLLASGANYRFDCRTSAGKVVSSAPVATPTAAMLAMEYVSAAAGPHIVIRTLLSSPGHVVCSLTPVSMLVCCPNAPQYSDFRLMPTVACGTDCTLTFSNMLNSTRYAVWCTTAPFAESTFALFPADDSGFRFDTPRESDGVSITTTTPPPETLGPVRQQTVDAVQLAGSAVARSAVLGAIIALALVVLTCVSTRSGRALYGLNPAGHSGPALPPRHEKLILLDSVVFASAIFNVVVIARSQSLESSGANSALCFFFGVSMCLFLYQVVVLGLFQFLISREKMTLDSIDLQTLSKLHFPLVSIAVSTSAGDAELEQAWATKATLFRREVGLVTIPSLITLAIRGTDGIFGILALLGLLAKLVVFCVTFTESVATGIDDELHTDQIQVIANKREYGPTFN